MGRDTAKSELLTFPQLRREYGIGIRSLRREADRGSFPVYSAGTSWPRVLRIEFERWLRSTQIRATSHARRRVDEICAREARRVE